MLCAHLTAFRFGVLTPRGCGWTCTYLILGRAPLAGAHPLTFGASRLYAANVDLLKTGSAEEHGKGETYGVHGPNEG